MKKIPYRVFDAKTDEVLLHPMDLPEESTEALDQEYRGAFPAGLIWELVTAGIDKDRSVYVIQL